MVDPTDRRFEPLAPVSDAKESTDGLKDIKQKTTIESLTEKKAKLENELKFAKAAKVAAKSGSVGGGYKTKSVKRANSDIRSLQFQLLSTNAALVKAKAGDFFKNIGNKLKSSSDK